MPIWLHLETLEFEIGTPVCHVMCPGAAQRDVEQVDKDLHRTWSKHTMANHLPSQTQLRRVLLAYAQHNPEIGYCQGTSPLPPCYTVPWRLHLLCFVFSLIERYVVCVVFVCWLRVDIVPLSVVLGALGSLSLLSILTIHSVSYLRPRRL
jgi:hypothetical protein